MKLRRTISESAALEFFKKKTIWCSCSIFLSLRNYWTRNEQPRKYSTSRQRCRNSITSQLLSHSLFRRSSSASDRRFSYAALHFHCYPSRRHRTRTRGVVRFRRQFRIIRSIWDIATTAGHCPISATTPWSIQNSNHPLPHPPPRQSDIYSGNIGFIGERVLVGSVSTNIL